MGKKVALETLQMPKRKNKNETGRFLDKQNSPYSLKQGRIDGEGIDHATALQKQLQGHAYFRALHLPIVLRVWRVSGEERRRLQHLTRMDKKRQLHGQAWV